MSVNNDSVWVIVELVSPLSSVLGDVSNWLAPATSGDLHLAECSLTAGANAWCVGSISDLPPEISTTFVSQLIMQFTPHQSDFYGPDALPDTQPTVSKHWRHSQMRWWGEVLACLSVWSKVQIACIWFSWCHCHPIISASAKSRMVYSSGTDSPG